MRDLTDRPFGVDILFATIRATGDLVDQFTDQVKGWADVALEVNAFTREWEKRTAEIQPFPLQTQRVGFPTAVRAREEGDVDNGHAACGQSAGLSAASRSRAR